MSYQLGPPINDIGHSPNPTPEQYSAPTQERYPTGVQEHYPIAIQEHYPSPIQDYHQPPASSPTPDYTSMPSDRQEDSRSATIASQNASHGREHGMYGADETVVDLHAPVQEKKHDADANNTPAAARTTGAEELGVPTAGPVETRGAEIKLSQKRKWFLLLVFSVAQYLDVASYSGLFVFTEAVLTDLGILYESSSWVITAYSVTFASFLLFWGRVADLYSAKPVFVYGFLALGIINLIISFMPNQYAYFIMRALSGIAGAATIPSAFRLILAIFEPAELQIALTLFGLSGAIANVTGLVIAGFFGFITAGGQLAAWRWFFRMITVVIMPFGFAALLLVPMTSGDQAGVVRTSREKFKRLDIVGCLTMLFSIILLILGLTLGASYGFKTAKFLVPFLLAWPLFGFFFVWEARLPEGYALIPPSTWRIPNFALLIFFALGVYPWWAVNQLPLVERYLVVFGEGPIIAAVRVLPQGIAALVGAAVTPPILEKLGSPRWPISIGMLLGAVTMVVMIFGEGLIHGNEYWRWYFPAFIVGSAGTMMAFLGTNITVMTSVPARMSGVAGALLQVALQLGAVISLSVQAGLFTLKPGNFQNFYNVQASFWFQGGWLLVNVIVFLIFFRPGRVAEGSEAAAAKEKGGEGNQSTVAV